MNESKRTRSFLPRSFHLIELASILPSCYHISDSPTGEIYTRSTREINRSFAKEFRFRFIMHFGRAIRWKFHGLPLSLPSSPPSVEIPRVLQIFHKRVAKRGLAGLLCKRRSRITEVGSAFAAAKWPSSIALARRRALLYPAPVIFINGGQMTRNCG